MFQFRSQRIRDFLAKSPKKISSLENKGAGSFLEDSIFMKTKKENQIRLVSQKFQRMLKRKISLFKLFSIEFKVEEKLALRMDDFIYNQGIRILVLNCLQRSHLHEEVQQQDLETAAADTTTRARVPLLAYGG